MSTYTSEPGTRLAGRYRLVDQTGTGTGWTFWRATDETLARPVSVLTFAPGFPRLLETITAARAAARLNDSRFTQVFDVEEAAEQPYVVLEWVRGKTLLDMLEEGPLEPPRAVSLIAEAAAALAAAHASGQAHLNLLPDRLYWTPGSGVKICGLGIDAALAGPDLVPVDTPEMTDTVALGRLLYAALTGYWPEPDGLPGLPAAPLDSDGTVCTPRQVAAGVPAGIDAVTCRALFQEANRQGPALADVAAFADALSPLAPAPAPPPATFAHATIVPGMSGQDGQDGEASTGVVPVYRPRYPATERSAVTRAVVSVVILLVLAAIGVAAWAISNSVHHSSAPSTGPSGQSRSASQSASAAPPLTPASVSVFNVKGNSDDPGDASAVLGSKSGAYWHTQYYFGDPAFGRLKPGVGLLLDMGSRVKLSQLTVQFGSSCCAHVTIGVSDSAATELSAFTPVVSNNNAVGLTTFNVPSSATAGRYVLIWITYLPPNQDNSGSYEARIYHVSVRGASA